MSRTSPLESAIAVKQDCPTGLARCTSGAVEITEGRAPCAGCACAWKRIEVCEHGCVVENVELVREPDRAAALCKPLPVLATLPPLLGADAASTAACPSDARFLCRAGNVFACPSGSSVAVAQCSAGCVTEGETVIEEGIDIAAATALLCARHDSGIVAP